MKPTSPEDRELEKMSSEASERYRAGSSEEPPARVDAAIVAAARREVDRTRQRRSWPVPASPSQKARLRTPKFPGKI